MLIYYFEGRVTTVHHSSPVRVFVDGREVMDVQHADVEARTATLLKKNEEGVFYFVKVNGVDSVATETIHGKVEVRFPE